MLRIGNRFFGLSEQGLQIQFGRELEMVKNPGSI